MVGGWVGVRRRQVTTNNQWVFQLFLRRAQKEKEEVELPRIPRNFLLRRVWHVELPLDERAGL